MFTSKEAWIIEKAEKESLKCQKLDEQTFQMKFDDVWYVWCCVEACDVVHVGIKTNAPL
jgi:hypothetical protein